MNNTLIVVQPPDVALTRRRAMLAYKYRLETSRRPNFLARYATHYQLAPAIFHATYALTGRDILIKGVTNRYDSEPAELYCITEPYILQVVLVTHPHIANLLDVLRAPNNDFVLEFEYYPHGSLLAHVQARGGVYDCGSPFGADEMLTVARHVCLALVYCHANFVAHCDVKLDNILVAGGSFRLSDFGSAHILEEGYAPPYYEVNPTGHRPPETLLGLPWSFPVDIWSLGCTLVELHCLARGLEHPFLYNNEATREEHLYRVCAFAGPIPESMCRGQVSRPACVDFGEMAEECMELYQIVRRMLATDPAQRITAAATVVWTSHRPILGK